MFSKQVLHSFALICFVLVFAKTLTDAKSVEVVQKEVVPSETVEKWECPFTDDTVGCYCLRRDKALICDGKDITRKNNYTIKIDLSDYYKDNKSQHFNSITIKDTTTNIDTVEFINITSDRLNLENNYFLENLVGWVELNFSSLVYSNNHQLDKKFDFSKINQPLEYLKIDNVPSLTKIPEFKFPKSLIHLVISSSGIRNISKDTFKDFSNLTYLDLNWNHLENLGFLSGLNSDKLKEINLEYNKLKPKSIPSAQFEKLSYGNKDDRVTIRLNGNRIDKFTKDIWLHIFDNPKENLYFDFGRTGNFIECDCSKMKWIVDMSKMSLKMLYSGFDHLECEGSHRWLGSSFSCH